MGSKARHGSWNSVGRVTATLSAGAIAGFQLRNAQVVSPEQLIATPSGGMGTYKVIAVSPSSGSLVMHSIGSTITLGGTATTLSNTAFAVTVSDLAGAVPVVLRFNLQAAATFVATVAVPSISATQNTALLSVTPVTATGGYLPYTWSITPPLPTGLTLNTATGAISGTSTVSSPLTTYFMTITDVLGGTGGVVTGNFNATVAAASGQTPTLAAPIGIVFTGAAAQVNTAIGLDYGLLSGSSVSDFWTGSPTTFTVQLYLAGAAISGGTTNMTSYTPGAPFGNKPFSYSVVASGGGSPSTPAYAVATPVSP